MNINFYRKSQPQTEKNHILLTISIYFLLSFSILFLHACNSSDSPLGSKKASIDISVEPDPIVFIWYSKEGYAEFDCLVTIYERVGVGGRIDEVSFECLFQNTLRERFAQKGAVFYPFRGMGLPFAGKVEDEVDQVRITAKGQDNNGHRLEKIKNFSVKWEED